MKKRYGILGLVVAVACSLAASAATLKGSPCAVPPLSDAIIADIVSRERRIRTDLPAPFETQKVRVLRDGCYYIYQEFHVPATPGMSRIFRLDQYGVIVDVMYGH